MQLTLKHTLLLILLVVALLIVLVGGIVRNEATKAPLPGFHSGVHSTQQLAWYCPAPPRMC
jgi:hypothetical protein